MKSIFLILFVVLLSTESYSDMIYLPPGSCLTVPSGSIVCSDTLFVDTNACFIGGDTGVICNTIVILGSGQVIIAIEPISSNIPENYSLAQNYPNPFNPTTKIRFSIPSNGKGQKTNVKIIVYDMLGKEVALLVKQEIQPGVYETEFNGSKFASGIYYYKLVTDDFAETKKLVLIK